MKRGKVYFVGAGPGDPELITVKGMKAVNRADIIIYTGSLVNPEILNMKKKTAITYNSASMDLDEITGLMVGYAKKGKVVVRLQTGDLSFYSALCEQTGPLTHNNIEFYVIPGVSSASASAAAIKKELTSPEITQTVIFTRISGRTPVPGKEDISLLSSHNATLCLFLSVGMIDKVVQKLRRGYGERTPVYVIYRATWSDEKILGGTLSDIAEKVRDAEIDRQAIIVIGNTLNKGIDEKTPTSRLYDKGFTHGYREHK